MCWSARGRRRRRRVRLCLAGEVGGNSALTEPFPAWRGAGDRATPGDLTGKVRGKTVRRANGSRVATAADATARPRGAPTGKVRGKQFAERTVSGRFAEPDPLLAPLGRRRRSLPTVTSVRQSSRDKVRRANGSQRARRWDDGLAVRPDQPARAQLRPAEPPRHDGDDAVTARHPGRPGPAKAAEKQFADRTVPARRDAELATAQPGRATRAARPGKVRKPADAGPHYPAITSIDDRQVEPGA